MLTCCAPGCIEPAYVEVILYDVYAYGCPQVFFQRDMTCQYLCDRHMAENELKAEGVRMPRGCTRYPFTNRNRAQGFTIYRPIGGSS